MSDIAYPVAPTINHTRVLDANMIEICDCWYAVPQLARRIAAALNATRHLTTEQLEAINHRSTMLLPVESGRTGAILAGVDGIVSANSGDTAKGE